MSDCSVWIQVVFYRKMRKNQKTKSLRLVLHNQNKQIATAYAARSIAPAGFRHNERRSVPHSDAPNLHDHELSHELRRSGLCHKPTSVLGTYHAKGLSFFGVC